MNNIEEQAVLNRKSHEPTRCSIPVSSFSLKSSKNQLKNHEFAFGDLVRNVRLLFLFRLQIMFIDRESRKRGVFLLRNAMLAFVLAILIQFTSTSNFSAMTDDNLSVVKLFLPNQDRCKLFRVINRKCNAIHKISADPIMQSISLFSQLLAGLGMDSLLGHRCTDTLRWRYIAAIHQRLRLEHPYAVMLPLILNSWSCALATKVFEIGANATVFEQVASAVYKALIRGQSALNLSIPLPDSLGKCTKSLIYVSCTLTRCLILKSLKGPEWRTLILLYDHLWSEIAARKCLPPLQSVPYLLENIDTENSENGQYSRWTTHLHYLMTEFGLTLYLGNNIRSPWTCINISEYVFWNTQISDILLCDLKLPEPVINTFDAKWVITLLQNVNSSHLHNYMATESHVFFEQIFWPMIDHLYVTEDADMLRDVMTALQARNAMYLFNHCGYLLAENFTINHSHYLVFMRVFYETLLDFDEDEQHIQRESTSHWIAQSVFLWISERKQESIELLQFISDEHLLTQIWDIHDAFCLVIDQRDYLDSIYGLIVLKQKSTMSY